jgi:AraC-like DNA-binding protein
MIKMYCDSQIVTDETFKHWYGINDNKLDELKSIGLSVGFFSMKVDQQKIKFYVKNTKNNDKSLLHLENNRPSVIIEKRHGRKKFIFSNGVKQESRPKSFKLIFRIKDVNYSLEEVCSDIGISDYHLKKNVRGLVSCSINGVDVEIIRKPKNSAYYNLTNLNNNKEYLNQTAEEARVILKCALAKLSSLGTGYHKAKINGFQVIRHNGEEI